MLEKLSMEVGCHTQSNVSTAGLSVTSVLEHLARKGRETKDKTGLKSNEVKGLDVDELELEKQRMKFLFYEQRNETKDADSATNALDQQPPMDPNTKVSEWVNKDHEILTEDDDLIMDPEKIVQITNLQQKVDSLKKVISEQRKKHREIQFAKERVKQCLAEEEKKAQQIRNVRPFMKIDDPTRWQKDQKKRLKDWDRLKREKTNELQKYECKERGSKSHLKALEQHLGELKKQLQACEGSSGSGRMLSVSEEFGSSKLLNEIPEGDWTSSNRPPRIMSTDSITTESSFMSGDNPEISKDVISIDSDASLSGFNDYSISAARNSPFSNRSDSSSPVGPAMTSLYNKGRYSYNLDTHGNVDARLMNGLSKLPLSRGHSADQDKRLRLLKEEHFHHISSMDNIPRYSNDEHTFQQLRHEAIGKMHTPDDQYGQSWSKSSTNVHLSHYKGHIDSSNVESSLSNTPDVVPEMIDKPYSSAMNLPYQTEGVYRYGKHSRPSSGMGFTDSNPQALDSSRKGLFRGSASSTNSIDHVGGGRVDSRESLFDNKPERQLMSSIHPYSSHGNVSNINQRSNHDGTTVHQIDSGRVSSASKKTTRQSNSPSTHKYSHRRPDVSLN